VTIKLTGEAKSTDKRAARSYPEHFTRLLEEGKYPPDLISNVDEAGLYWKKMLSRTFISRGEKHAPGYNLTLLLGAGNVKLKSLLVYHSES
jgi:hypothetical protein